MKDKTLSYIILVVAFIVLLIYTFGGGGCKLSCKSFNEAYSKEDEKVGEKVLKELHNLLENEGEIEEISDDELVELADNIYISVVEGKDKSSTRENLSFFHAENTRYWPYYYYSFPYNYKHGGAWPPGLFSRLYFWSPGFYTGTGWSYSLRPGLKYSNWPRHRWIKQKKSGSNYYYFITNNDDYTHGAADYANTQLSFA